MAILLVGLGNPGTEYINTRHNIGFMVIDAFKQTEDIEYIDRFHGKFAKINSMLLLKPQTYMNLSGKSVSAASSFYKIPPHNIWVVHDDIDLEFGKIKIKQGGGNAGHNGLKSIDAAIGVQYHRIRIGVGRPIVGSVSDYVLSNFTADEMKTIQEIINKLVVEIPQLF